MALETVWPFTYQAFNEQIGETALATINYFRSNDPDFWSAALRRYSFRGADYERGEKVRLDFNKKISSYRTDGELVEIANEILEWGGMASFPGEIQQELKRSLACLNLLAREEPVDLDELYVKRLASITKIYEMWDLDNWVIYDSYCARGLQWLIAGLWQSIGHKTNERLLNLPWPPGRVGGPINGFPRAADTAPRQQRLGFIYSSWLCKAIAERLSVIQDDGFHWRPFHIEMIAFQLGHEIGQ